MVLMELPEDLVVEQVMIDVLLVLQQVTLPQLVHHKVILVVQHQALVTKQQGLEVVQ